MAYSAGTVVRSEFAGEYQLAYVVVDTDGATGDVTLSEYDEVFVLSVELNEDPASGCAYATAKEDGTTENKINIKLWENDFTAATATYKDVRIVVLGLLKSNP